MAKRVNVVVAAGMLAAVPGIASDFDSLDQDHDGRLTLFEIHHPADALARGAASAQRANPPAAPDAARERSRAVALGAVRI